MVRANRLIYENYYIESLWWLLQQFYKKGLLYKGYTIQPYSPVAGTGLSSHELNQPGCYYVTTEDGTGIVHIAPTYGADDAKVAKDAGMPSLQNQGWTVYGMSNHRVSALVVPTPLRAKATA